MSAVRVEVKKQGSGEQVNRNTKYTAHVTLYIEDKKGNLTPSGWSTRKPYAPFTFQPYQNLIEGWSEGVVQMKIGERSYLHVPAAKGYGSTATGAPGGAFFIPANSDLCFDLEILHSGPCKNCATHA